MSVNLAELAERFLPSYLLPQAREELLRHINEFPHERGYYSMLSEPRHLQGDVWRGFIVFNFDEGTRKAVSGIVISNSCDVAEANRSIEDQRVTFAPIIRVERYVDLLRTSGRTDEQIESTVGRMKRQHVNNIFFLPGTTLIPDSIVLLDNLHSEPLRYFWESATDRLVRLSDFGFWLFVLKLSIHFTRLQEEVQRGSA